IKHLHLLLPYKFIHSPLDFAFSLPLFFFFSRSVLPSAMATPNCRCGEVAVLRTSWAEANPGRRFYGCRKYGGSNACNYFRWADPALDEHVKQVIRGLNRRIHELERKNSHSSVYEGSMKLGVMILAIFIAKSV
ncbi:unnamed protein product, partial [Linum tenue]